uniref:Uncharacterized protein n=1 Tax=Arundo donax TaxID=35708 RepID=A0A0A8ZUL6_ARUDO
MSFTSLLSYCADVFAKSKENELLCCSTKIISVLVISMSQSS